MAQFAVSYGQNVLGSDTVLFMANKATKLVHPKKIKIDAWQCPCGTVTAGRNGEMPVRCSNRKTCNRKFE